MGEQLGLPGHELEVIAATHTGDYRLYDCLSHMFRSWLRCTTNKCTYENLAQALASIREEKLAADVYKKTGEYYFCSDMILLLLQLRWFGLCISCTVPTINTTVLIFQGALQVYRDTISGYCSYYNCKTLAVSLHCSKASFITTQPGFRHCTHLVYRWPNGHVTLGTDPVPHYCDCSVHSGSD